MILPFDTVSIYFQNFPHLKQYLLINEKVYKSHK